MAKAFLLRWGTQNDFDSIKLQTRELGMATDTEKIYLGTEDANVHIPNEGSVNEMIKKGVAKHKPISGSTSELTTEQILGSIAYNTTKKTLQYKTEDSQVIDIARKRDLPAGEPVSVVVTLENIDDTNENSVTLSEYDRPIKMVFLNGVLCTNNAADPHKYTIDEASKTLTVKQCAANDIIAYY